MVRGLFFTCQVRFHLAVLAPEALVVILVFTLSPTLHLGFTQVLESGRNRGRHLGCQGVIVLGFGVCELGVPAVEVSCEIIVDDAGPEL
jgi:hypothetical protein